MLNLGDDSTTIKLLFIANRRLKFCFQSSAGDIPCPNCSKVDSVIQYINHHPLDYYHNKNHQLLDTSKTNGWCYPPFEELASGGKYVTIFVKALISWKKN